MSESNPRHDHRAESYPRQVRAGEVIGTEHPSTTDARLIHEGLSAAAVKMRRDGALADLRRHGYVIASAEDADERQRACELLNAHVPGLNVGAGEMEGSRITVARHRRTGAIHAAADLIPHPKEHGLAGTVARVTALAVDPEHRGHHLGLAILHESPRLMRAGRLSMIYGACPEDQAAFYARGGYAVMRPGQVLDFPGGARAMNTNAEAPCWFYRHP